MSDHTSTPWQWQMFSGEWHLVSLPSTKFVLREGVGGGHLHLRDDGRKRMVPFDPSHPDAKFIVRACNAHEDLLAACKSVSSVGINDEVLDQLAAAIAKAEGEEPTP